MRLAARMVVLAGLADSDEGRSAWCARRSRRAPASRSSARSSRGRAAIRAVVDDYRRLPQAAQRHTVTRRPRRLSSPRSTRCRSAAPRWRSAPGAIASTRRSIPAVGVVARGRRRGDEVAAGDPLLELHYNDAGQLFEAHPRWSTKPLTLADEPSRDAVSLDEVRMRRESEPLAGALVDARRRTRRRRDSRSGPRALGSATDWLILGPAAAVAVVAALVAQFGGLPRRRPWSAWSSFSASPTSGRRNRRAIDMRTVVLGARAADSLCADRAEDGVRPRTVPAARRADHAAARFAVAGSSFVFGPLGDPPVWRRVLAPALGEEARGRRRHLRVPRAADDHLRRRALRDPLLLRRHAARRPAVRARACGAFMRASGAESLNVAASIFMGQTEAPLTIRPYLPTMTQSELMTVMTSGMAHISGGIMAAYILFGIEAQHLLTAVIMTAPGTLMMAKIFVPETESPATMGTVKLQVETTDVNVIDAAGRGTGEGAAPRAQRRRDADLVSRARRAGQRAARAARRQHRRSRAGRERWLGTTLEHLSLQMMLGWVFAPVAWAIGVPWHDADDDRQPARHAHGAQRVRRLFAARALKASLDPRSFTIATFALCGFANFVDRHPDRRHRRAGADAPPRSGAARHPRDDCRHARQLRHRDDCGVTAVTDATATTIASPKRRPTSAARVRRQGAGDRGGARLGPRRLRRHAGGRGVDAVRRHSALARRRRWSATKAGWWSATRRAAARSPRCRAARISTRATTCAR